VNDGAPTLGIAATLVPGARRAGAPGDPELAGLSIDSRTLAPGEAFVALRAQRDGHDFAAAALARGASALVVGRELDLPLPQLVVADGAAALQALGAGWRARFDLPLACVTGSNGKTTVTQMVASILRARWGADGSLATRGNRNNALGVPLVLFGLRPSHRAAVLELGMNHPGEIAPLAAAARPSVALVNNAQREHQEFLGSVRATAMENGAVIDALPPGGCAVFPADDACAPLWRERAGARRVLDFALAAPAAITATFEAGERSSLVRMRTPGGPVEAGIALPGVHNVRNALAACAVGLALGAGTGDVARGLADFRAVAGRGVRRAGPGGTVLIDDSYNANPDSVRAAIEALARLAGWRLLALGDMAETGRDAEALHHEVGAYARACGIDALYATGPLAAVAAAAYGSGARHFADAGELGGAARAALAQHAPAAAALVKGSRSMRMERVVEAIAADAAGNGEGGGAC